MKKYRVYRFQLRITPDLDATFRRFAGCCRFVWNKALALEQESYIKTGKSIGFYTLNKMLTSWKRDESMAFLSEAIAQSLQCVLINLSDAYKRFYTKGSGFPKFKKRGKHDAFRCPQGFVIDDANGRVRLPKVGWVRYRKSRDIVGSPKNVVVSLAAGKWYVSIQTEMEVPTPAHPSDKAVGIDLGVAKFATLSDGTTVSPVNALKKYLTKLARLQRRIERKRKFSNNWNKLKAKISKLHCKIANTRRDFLHKLSTDICKNHAVVVMEDLKVENMLRSARGTIEKPGRNVKAKTHLNRSIRDQGWGNFKRQIFYKQQWLGGEFVVVNPQYTSQCCNNCGCIDKRNRPSQATFHCVACGHEDNADVNAAKNILAAGLAVLACGEERAQASSMKQEPTRMAAQ